MNKTIYNLKSGYYKVVDNQGVSVTNHFTQCLEKEFADLEVKLAITEKALELACEELMPYRINMCGGLYTTYELTNKIEDFKKQAKELKGENK